VLGPSLTNIETDGATRVEGMDAATYVYHSILYPSDHIAPECPTGPCAGPPSAMPANFGARMGENPQDMADMLAVLLGRVGVSDQKTSVQGDLTLRALRAQREASLSLNERRQTQK
jgi:hypothetical protein